MSAIMSERSEWSSFYAKFPSTFLSFSTFMLIRIKLLVHFEWKVTSSDDLRAIFDFLMHLNIYRILKIDFFAVKIAFITTCWKSPLRWLFLLFLPFSLFHQQLLQHCCSIIKNYDAWIVSWISLESSRIAFNFCFNY